MPRFPDAEELCAQLIRKAGFSPPPTDLDAVSSLWPRLKVSEEDLDKEGYLVFLGARGAELLLRRADPRNRKRFTFAHELGHWALSNIQNGKLSFDNVAPVARSTHGSRQTPEEIWCNEFAGKLLMPTPEVHRYLHGEAEDVPRKIVTGHTVFHVSEDAFLKRITEITGWIIAYLIHGRDLHKIGKQFMRPSEDRVASDQLVGELLRQTCGMVQFPDSQIRLPGFIAYGVPKDSTRDTSRYLVCLMPEDGSGGVELNRRTVLTGEHTPIDCMSCG